MPSILKCFLWLLLPVCGYTQNGVYYIPSDKEYDSVRLTLASTDNDTLKMSAYYYISGWYTELNKDSSLHYAKLQLNAAKKLKRPLWAANACFQISYLSFELGNYPESFRAIAEGLAITDNPARAIEHQSGTRDRCAQPGLPGGIKAWRLGGTGQFLYLRCKDTQ